MNFRQTVWFIVIALVVGGIGGVLLNRFGIPFLSSMPGLSWAHKLESNNPVVINRREEVQFNEGIDLINLTKQISTYTVTIYSGSAANLKFSANGIVTSSDGLILAPKSNLPPAGTVTVVLNDGTNYTGTIRALDPKADLAVITIPASNLAFAQFGVAADLVASQRVVFVGRSNTEFTRNFTEAQVTQPINNGRSIDRVFYSENFENTVLTSANLTPDFAGAPMADLDGKVVGMVTSQGILIGEDLQMAVSSYLANSKIFRPGFGIKYLNLSNSLAKLKNLPQGGVLVVSVDDNSPAKQGGLQAGDLITSFDGQDLSTKNFETLFNAHPIGNVTINILRNGNPTSLTIKLTAK